MAKKIFFEEICDRVFCGAAESFEDEAGSTLVVLNCISLCTLLFLLVARKPKPCITLR